jgi:hypothetical protein
MHRENIAKRKKEKKVEGQSPLLNRMKMNAVRCQHIGHYIGVRGVIDDNDETFLKRNRRERRKILLSPHKIILT